MKQFFGLKAMGSMALACAALFAPAAQASCQGGTSRYVVSANSDEVTDCRTGLIWQRCTVGQTASAASCTGPVTSFDHEQALAYARDNAGAVGWRLPDVKELTSLVDFTRENPSIDPIAFPDTSPTVYWSSTPNLSGLSTAFAVTFGTGNVSDRGRTVGRLVRLVRRP